MKLHIIKENGDSVLMSDVRIVHLEKYCSIEDRKEGVNFWSRPVQHDNVKQQIDITFPK